MHQKLVPSSQFCWISLWETGIGRADFFTPEADWRNDVWEQDFGFKRLQLQLWVALCLRQKVSDTEWSSFMAWRESRGLRSVHKCNELDRKPDVWDDVCRKMMKSSVFFPGEWVFVDSMEPRLHPRLEKMDEIFPV